MQIFYMSLIAFFIIAIVISIIIMKITYNSEIEFKKISEKISDGYIILTKNLKITNYNKAFLKFMNLKEKDIKRKNLRIVLNKMGLKENDKKQILEALENIEEQKKTNFIVKRKHRTYKFEIMNLVDNDIFMRYVILIKDITQNYNAIENLKSNQELLANRERFATLGGLISGIAHSLKSPIFAITGELEGFIDLAEEYKESSGDESVSVEDHKEIIKEMREWLQKMKEQMEQISDAITAIRSQIVVLNSDEEIAFTIEDLVKYVNIIMKNTLKQKLIILNFTVKVPGDTEIKGNFNSLVQVINNLILNSIDSYKGKTNEIIEIVIDEEDKNLIISVMDNGCRNSKRYKA